MHLSTSFITLSLLLLCTKVSAAEQAPVNNQAGGENSHICAEQAKKVGHPHPDGWVWSSSARRCINTNAPDGSPAHKCAPLIKELDDWLKAHPRAAPKLPLSQNPTELDEDCKPLLQGRIASVRPHHTPEGVVTPLPTSELWGSCSEGYDACMDNCSQFSPGSWQDGGSGAYAGCVADCATRCGGSTDRGGCYKGWCWAGCHTGVAGPWDGQEWCYTTKTYSQSYDYVRCSSDDECSLDWHCGGPCALF